MCWLPNDCVWSVTAGGPSNRVYAWGWDSRGGEPGCGACAYLFSLLPPPPGAGPLRDPDEKLQEPPATPRRHKTPKKPGNTSLETYARKQNRAASFKSGAASAMLEDDDFYDNL